MAQHECEIVETSPGVWYYLWEENVYAGGEPWQYYSDSYGPFTSAAAAYRHLHDNHVCPTGLAVIPYSGKPPSKLMLALMAAAPAYMATSAIYPDDDQSPVYEFDLTKWHDHAPPGHQSRFIPNQRQVRKY